MLKIIVRLENMEAIRRRFADQGMLKGTTSWYTAREMRRRYTQSAGTDDEDDESESEDLTDDDGREDDQGPVYGSQMFSSIGLSQTYGALD